MIFDHQKFCFVCRTSVPAGTEVERIGGNLFMFRHATCVPKPKKPKPAPAESPGSPRGAVKRRRAGGHGYTGGDGFVRL